LNAVKGVRIDSPAAAAIAALALAISVFAFCAAPAASLADTCPNESSRIGPSAGLPECRVYELITPGLNNAAPASWPEVDVRGITTDGSAVAFVGASSPFEAEGATAPTNFLLARRGPAGWATRSLSAATPLSSGTNFGIQASTVGISEDLTQSVLWSDQPLAGGASPAGNNLYLRRADGTIVALTKVGSAGYDPGSFLAGASRDFSRLFLDTNVKQTAEDPLLNGNLYEYSAGVLRLVTIVPEAVEEPAPAGGFLPEGVLSPVSEDGSQVIFKANGYPGLFLRSDHLESVEVSDTQKVPPNINPPANAKAVGVAADGSEVFFTSASELTDDAYTGRTAGLPNNAGSDLYSFDVSSGDLTDLTVDTEAADAATGANVQEVLGASRNGEYLYFVALGKLATGATSGQRNLYVEHDGAIKFIATDPKAGSHFYVTPDGLHAAFTSTALRPGYNNAGQAMAYRYDYGAAVQCASCRPDGEPPTTGASIAGRALSDDGDRLFFQSADAVLPRAQSAAPNVYEYLDGEVHLLTPGEGDSAILLGGSASGDDVFIASFEELSPQGQGKVFAIYDARVNAVVPGPDESKFVCQNEGCRGQPSVVATEMAPGSASFEAPAKISAPLEKASTSSKIPLRVIVPGAGSLEIEGRGFAEIDRKPTKAGSVAFTIALKKGADRKRRRFGIFRTEADIAFRSAAGNLSRANVQLIFRRGGK
jgi:hypothetical protein